MKRLYWPMLVAVCIASLLLASCARTPATAPSEPRPATLEKQGDGQPAKVILTETGAKRIELQTATVADGVAGGARRAAVPYAAILYDNKGQTWTYTKDGDLTFVRQAVTIDQIEGDQAFLSAGPPAGTVVVTVGVAELYGAETQFAK